MSTSYTFTEIVRMADKAKQPIEQLIRTAQVLEEFENRRQEQRRSSPDEKEAITKHIKTLEANGHLSGLLPTVEILAGANVRKVQGTSSYAAREMKRILQLTDLNKDIRKAA